MKERMRDWANLPADLIHLITNNLPDVTDFIRFRAVCKGWRSSAPLSDPPPQLPWLLECISEDAPRTKLKEELRFYCLSTDETGTLFVNEPNLDISYHGPCSGYLILLSVFARHLWMWNPLTNADVSFPSLRPGVFSFWPVWTGSDPILTRNIAFVARNPANHDRIGCWAYRPGNTEWNVMDVSFYNACYWDGMFFTTSGGCNTKVFDGTSQKLLYEILSPDDEDDEYPGHPDDPWPVSYLVEISGVIMRISMYLFGDQNVEEASFFFYELHFEGRDRKPSWVEVSDIGNHMLFLDIMNGFSMKPVSGFKGNCIYFLSRRGGTPCRYDIATDTFERVPCPFEACTWFLPSLY